MTHSSPNLPHDSAPLGEDERLLQAHFSARLDPHLGSSRRRFEQMLANEALPPVTQPLRVHEIRGTGWRWSLGLVAAAASVAMAVGLWALLQSTQPVVPAISQLNGNGANGYTPLEYSESWEAQDLGMYEFDGRPVRAVHQQQWERSRYRDAKGYEVQIEEPRSRLVLVDAPVQ